MTSPWVITINADVTFPGTGGASAMYYSVPVDWYGTVEVDGTAGRCLRADVAGKALRELACQGAARVGRRLHHADWVITADAIQVVSLSQPGRCPCERCAADLADIVKWMAGHPDREMAVGVLWWLAEAPVTVRDGGLTGGRGPG